MAKYDAQINLLVSGQRELDRLADRLRSIERQIVDINRLGVSPQQRDPVTGRFGADPDRQNRIRLAGIQRIGKEEERRARLTSARLRGQNAELERSILLQSHLNSAVSLYETQLEKLSRGGGGVKLSESLREQVKDIQAAYDAATAGGTKNLSIVRSLGTELGRIVERQNEINRLSSFQSKSFYDTQRFERRIAELRRAGVAASEFGGIGGQIRQLRSAQARGSEFEAKDISRRIKESLDRIARELETVTRQAKIENTARIAARSWNKFFEEANINTRRLEQNQKDAAEKFRSFFEDAANQAFEIKQNAKDTRRAWQNFFEDAQKEAERIRNERISGFARRRGRPDQYGIEAGPLPAGAPGAPRYFQEAKQIADQLFDVENEIGKIRQDSLSESLRLETERLSLVEKRKQKESQIRDVLLEAVTFGRGSQVKRAASDIAVGGRNALVRGGLGLGALGIGGAYASVQESLQSVDLGPLTGSTQFIAERLGGAINSALGGVPEIINQMLSALGNVPSSLGLASVAALAFAPAMKTAADAVFLAGKTFGESKFGEDIKLTLDRQTNLFESVINKASEMNMVLDASRSGLDAVGRKIETLPALPAAGQTAFRGAMRRGRGGAFIGGGAREITNPEFLATAAGTMAQRTQEAAQTSLMFAEGLGQAANEAKTIAEYLKQANELRAKGESSTQRFIRQTIERGRIAQQDKTSADIARERSAFLTGSPYSLAQVPAGGELFPGGRTETAAPQYREMLNTAAKVSQLQQEILESMSKQQGFAATIGQLERRTVNDKGRSLQIQQEENSELQRSIQIIRERNRELRQRPISAMTPQERVSGGILDPSSLRASRRRRVEQGRARQESIRRAASEGLIGGAFPLLFGQGIGASIGGAAGGFGGGFLGGGLGFGLSLVGTALGTAFDTAVQSAQELGAALNEAAETFDKVKERSLFASKEAEKLAGKAQEFGAVATANVLAQQAVIDKIGTSGAKSLQNLATSSDKLNRAWAEFNLQLQAALSGPMAGLLEWVTEIVKRINSESRTLADVQDTLSGLPADKREEFAKRNAQIGAQRGGFAIQGLRDFGINIGISPEEANKQRQDLIKEFAQFVVPVKVKPSIEQIEQEQLNLLTKELEAIDIARPFIDAARSADREQQDLDKQRAELVRSYEESIGNIRKQVEDEVRSRRLAVLETENQILDQQGQNRVNQLRLINQQFVALAGQGQRPEVEDAAKRAAQIVAQFTEQQLSAEEEAAQVKRNAALDALKFDTQAAEFKANIEKEVARLNIETARRVADINEQVRRRNEDFDARRFELEKQIAEIKLAAIGRQVSALNLEAAAYNDPNIQATTASLVKNIIRLQDQIATAEAPAPLRGIPEGSIGGQGVSTGQLEAVIGQQKDRTQKLVNEILAGLDLTKATDIANFKNQVADLAKSFNAPIVAFAQNFNDELQASSRYIELLNQGLKGTTAQQVIQVEQARAIAIAQYNQAIASLEQKKNAKETSELAKGDIESQIVDLQNARDALLGAVSTAVKDVVLNQSIITARETMKAMKEEMNELLDKVNRAKFTSETLGQGIAGGITGSISAISGFDVIQERMKLEGEVDQLKGLRDKAEEELARQREIGKDSNIDNSEAIRKAAENYSEYTKRIEEARSEMDRLGDTGRRVQEVLANMLKGIGDAFLEMAQRIIAQQITMILFGTILKALGVTASAGSNMSESGIAEKTLAPMRQYPVLEGLGVTPSAKGSYFANGIAAFANGGMFTNSIVSSPTLFKFADGGALRTGVMGEAGPEAIMPLKRGPGGRLGVDASGSGGDNIAVTVNVDAKGSSVQGDDQRGNQLGRAISAAVQQELIRQKRPGGLLA